MRRHRALRHTNVPDSQLDSSIDSSPGNNRMTTPQPLKHAPSQQGKTPQASQHGAAATPGASASTPYSNLHAFSPHAHKSSPQQLKKSPATTQALMATSQPAPAPMNFDSPSAAALFGGFDLASDHMGIGEMGLPRPSGDEERQKRLEEVTQILGVTTHQHIRSSACA